jgi:hypothetical protein
MYNSEKWTVFFRAATTAGVWFVVLAGAGLYKDMAHSLFGVVIFFVAVAMVLLCGGIMVRCLYAIAEPAEEPAAAAPGDPTQPRAD